MVFIFIFATAGLLIWAAVKPWVGKWVDVSFLCGMLGLGITADCLALPECEGTKELCASVESG